MFSVNNRRVDLLGVSILGQDDMKNLIGNRCGRRHRGALIGEIGRYKATCRRNTGSGVDSGR